MICPTVPECCADARESQLVYCDARGTWRLTAHVDDTWAEAHGEPRRDDRDGNAYPISVAVKFCPFCGQALRQRTEVRPHAGTVYRVTRPEYVTDGEYVDRVFYVRADELTAMETALFVAGHGTEEQVDELCAKARWDGGLVYAGSIERERASMLVPGDTRCCDPGLPFLCAVSYYAGFEGDWIRAVRAGKRRSS